MAAQEKRERKKKYASSPSCGCGEHSSLKVLSYSGSTLTERCENTRQLLTNIRVDTLFTTPFADVLQTALANLTDQNLIDLVQDVIDVLTASTPTITLRQLYAVKKELYSASSGAFGAASAEFVIPFLGLSGAKRVAAGAFLIDQNGDDEKQTFLHAFGSYTVDKLFGIQLRDLHLWKQHLLREASKKGVLREYPDDELRAESLAKGNCAVYTPNGWKCTGGEYEDGCGLENGQPIVGTDYC